MAVGLLTDFDYEDTPHREKYSSALGAQAG